MRGKKCFYKIKQDLPNVDFNVHSAHMLIWLLSRLLLMQVVRHYSWVLYSLPIAAPFPKRQAGLPILFYLYVSFEVIFNTYFLRISVADQDIHLICSFIILWSLSFVPGKACDIAAPCFLFQGCYFALHSAMELCLCTPGQDYMSPYEVWINRCTQHHSLGMQGTLLLLLPHSKIMDWQLLTTTIGKQNWNSRSKLHGNFQRASAWEKYITGFFVELFFAVELYCMC